MDLIATIEKEEIPAFYAQKMIKRDRGVCYSIHASIVIKEEGNHQDDIAHQFPRVNVTMVSKEASPLQ